MEPSKYLDIHSKEILEDCEITKLVIDGENLIKEIKLIINDLKEVRISYNKTIECCKKYTKQFEIQIWDSEKKRPINSPQVKKEFDIQVSLYTKWLIKALEVDDSFIYSYNYMVQFYNRNGGLLPINIKDSVDVAELSEYGTTIQRHYQQL